MEIEELQKLIENGDRDEWINSSDNDYNRAMCYILLEILKEVRSKKQ